ncbi:hypothetical protein IWQ57_003935, partial [Coemansia nantahalensis]
FLDTLSNHYPERLGRAAVFQPPRFFVAFFSLVSPFIDPVTKAKVSFVDPSAPAPAESAAATGGPWIALEDVFDRQALEKDCGGDSPASYSHAAYWPAVEAEFALHKAQLLAKLAPPQ